MSDHLKQHWCATCRFHRYADRKPRSLLARLWRWHTNWCPGWRSYQRHLAAAEADQPAAKEPDS